MDDLLEHAARAVLRGLYLLLRLAIWLVLELCIEIILWRTGWCACRVLTFNHRPTAPIDGQDQVSSLTYFFVCTSGFLALVALAIGLARIVG